MTKSKALKSWQKKVVIGEVGLREKYFPFLSGYMVIFFRIGLLAWLGIVVTGYCMCIQVLLFGDVLTRGNVIITFSLTLFLSALYLLILSAIFVCERWRLRFPESYSGDVENLVLKIPGEEKWIRDVFKNSLESRDASRLARALDILNWMKC